MGETRHGALRIYGGGTLALAGFLLCIGASVGLLASGDRGAEKVLWSISVSQGATLEDIRGDGVFLVRDHSTTLSLHGIQDGKLASSVSLAGWDDYERSHRVPGQLNFFPLIGPFRLLRHADRILGVEYPWLVLLDARSGTEIHRALPSEKLADFTSPLWRDAFVPPLLAVDLRAQDDTVAIAYNFGGRPQIFVYNSDLTQKLHAWQRDRYINYICWSPDGKWVAVLYSQLFNQESKYVGLPIKHMRVRFPDVEVIDAESGATVNEFFTGGREAMIDFSPDGSLLYTISQWNSMGIGRRGPGVIRVFSPKTGSLVRTISGERTGVWERFAVSPHGDYIVANASTALRHMPLTDIPPGANERWDVLQSATGKVVFHCLNKTNGDFVHDTGGPLFSSDGRELIVAFGSFEIVAYALP